METSARYTIVGLFVLAGTLALFAFVYWLHHGGGLVDRQIYRIRFQSSVSGLLAGSNVLFNGIRAGEVTALSLNPEAPKEVLVTIAVDPSVPMRADTVVGIDFQGLTGAPVIVLSGGDQAAAPIAREGSAIPVIDVAGNAGQSLTQSARETLGRLDQILDENAVPLNKAITSIGTFSEALARNSSKIDGILAGLERFAGGAKARKTVYDLAAAHLASPCTEAIHTPLLVSEPAAPMAFTTDKIVIVGEVPADVDFESAQLMDNIPALAQVKLLESFEGSGCFETVARPADNLEGVELSSELRRFSVSLKPDPVAEIEIAANVVDKKGILASRVFRTASPLKTIDAPGAVGALDLAFASVAKELIPWAAEAARTAPVPPAEPEPPAP
jgi:phospholipid/cholesterol/gamma-HCH transport system substrate-binding protein